MSDRPFRPESAASPDGRTPLAMRFAERNGAYDATFKGLNDAMAGGH